jgi:hypothetical protein
MAAEFRSGSNESCETTIFMEIQAVQSTISLVAQRPLPPWTSTKAPRAGRRVHKATTTIIVIQRDSQSGGSFPPFSTIPMALSLIAASSRSSWSTARNGHLWSAGCSFTIFHQ